MTLAVTGQDGGVVFGIKVVPGSRQDRIAGLYGDVLRIAVAAPPERGRANAAVCALLARVLGVPERDVAVVGGAHDPRKRILVRHLSAAELQARLGV